MTWLKHAMPTRIAPRLRRPFSALGRLETIYSGGRPAAPHDVHRRTRRQIEWRRPRQFQRAHQRWSVPSMRSRYRQIGREEDARDVCQETFLGRSARSKGFEGRRSSRRGCIESPSTCAETGCVANGGRRSCGPGRRPDGPGGGARTVNRLRTESGETTCRGRGTGHGGCLKSSRPRSF